jgi:integrase
LSTIARRADPEQNFGWLTEMCRVLERTARREGPVRSKQGRLLPSGRLFEAGLTLAQRARQSTSVPELARAKDFRDGLMIALLAARPLRIKNFASLRLGQHLGETLGGYLINIPGRECKTGNPIEMPVPHELCSWLQEYLELHRLILLAGRCSEFVWVHKDGPSYQTGALAQRIPKLTKRLLGVAISPHLFRDCAATTIATEDPEHVLIIAPLLGHRTLDIAEKHYNHARGLVAHRSYQYCIGDLRKSVRPARHRPERM